MTTPLPAKLRPASPNRYEGISRHLLQQAEEELEKGNVQQASGKIWGATAYALKAIAQDRGWNHRFHNHLRAAAYYLALVWRRPLWNNSFDTFDNLHTNFYEHQIHVADLSPKLELATVFCQELYGVRAAEPPDDTHLTPAQQAAQGIHLRTLTRPLSEQTAFGDQFTAEEDTDLPSVSPTQP